MRIESGRMLNDYIQPNKKQYCIPVFQRDYAWTSEPVSYTHLCAKRWQIAWFMLTIMADRAWSSSKSVIPSPWPIPAVSALKMCIRDSFRNTSASGRKPMTSIRAGRLPMRHTTMYSRTIFSPAWEMCSSLKMCIRDRFMTI